MKSKVRDKKSKPSHQPSDKTLRSNLLRRKKPKDQKCSIKISKNGKDQEHT